VAELTFSAAELADCAEREVRQRQRAYPRWVEAGRMTQQLADRQTALMQAIACKLRAEADAEGRRAIYSA
jgi:signal recognition particle subunit SEC65